MSARGSVTSGLCRVLLSYAVAEMTPFALSVLDLVERIPPGKVMAYGEIAAYLGEGGPRQVGAVLRDWGHEVPWHRVLRADGRPAVHKANEQLDLLRGDGTPIHSGRVDMSLARLDPSASPRRRKRNQAHG